MRWILIFSIFYSSLGITSNSNEELAKKVQNPIADLISFPMQYNALAKIGPYERALNVLNLQPVVPIHLSKKWNLITRTIFPLIWAPDFNSESGNTFGLSDIDMSLFFSPVTEGKFMWGLGPVIWFPTSTNDEVGFGEWAFGPSLVLLATPKPWVLGVTVRQVWSIESSNLSLMTLQYFINYNFKTGTYITSAPILKANWTASEKKWVVPFGGGVGQVLKIGKLPINLSFSAYYNVVAPEIGPHWSARLQLQFIFPRGVFF